MPTRLFLEELKCAASSIIFINSICHYLTIIWPLALANIDDNFLTVKSSFDSNPIQLGILDNTRI